MKKLFVFLILLSYSFGASKQFTQEMNYFTNYNQALHESKKQNKPIFLMISTKTCPWCRKLEAQTLKKDYIDSFIHKNFIPLSLIQDKDIYPKKFTSKVVPTIYIVNPNEMIIHKIRGYKPHKKFISIINEGIKEK